MSINFRKVAVVGCGFVGSSSAFALMQSGLFSEMVLLDVNRAKAEGEAMDIGHGTSISSPMNIYAGDYSDIKDAAIIIVTAGAAQKPGETRLDLIKKNIQIHSGIMAEIKAQNPEGILLIVANPVDILTYYAQKASGMPENRVFGSGTVLDSARLRYLLGTRLDVDFFALRGMGGDLDMKVAQEDIAEDVKNAAYKIIERKNATYYGIAMSVVRICRAILRDEKSILPVSTALHGEYGISDVSLSVPAIVGRNGIEELVPISLSEEERTKLSESAAVLKKTMEGVEF